MELCRKCSRAFTTRQGRGRHEFTCRELGPPPPPPVAVDPMLSPVRCFDCAREFPNAIVLGQHRTWPPDLRVREWPR